MPLSSAEVSSDHLPNHASNGKRFHICFSLEGYESATIDNDTKKVDKVTFPTYLLTLAECQEFEDLGHSINISKAKVTEDVSFLIQDLENALGLTGINVCY